MTVKELEERIKEIPEDKRDKIHVAVGTIGGRVGVDYVNTDSLSFVVEPKSCLYTACDAQGYLVDETCSLDVESHY